MTDDKKASEYNIEGGPCFTSCCAPRRDSTANLAAAAAVRTEIKDGCADPRARRALPPGEAAALFYGVAARGASV